MNQLDHCRRTLIRWSKANFPNNRKVIRGLIEQLEEVKAEVYTEQSKEQIQVIKGQIEDFWNREETY